jgi:arginyl-tRNA synthetase
MNLRRLLEQRLSRAFGAADLPGAPAMVAPSARPELADYQANGALPAAKALKTDPRKLAERIVACAAGDGAGDLADIAEAVKVSGPGFINVRLRPAWMACRLSQTPADPLLGAEPADPPQRIVVDYSAPNLAKEMHVGHLRSTIIGDALARTLDFLGHHVIRQNHVGDWGTQFGMLLAYMDRTAEHFKEQPDELKDLEQYYAAASDLFQTDPAFGEMGRKYVVALQSEQSDLHDHLLVLWKDYVGQSLEHCQRLYERLGVTLERQDVRGESAYNEDLPSVVASLKAAGLLTESQGAQCVFLKEFTGKDGQPLPLIVQKSDEGYLYATTDLAAIRYRVGTLRADRILYVVDARQGLHFRQVFAVARKAGFAPAEVSLEHVAFGTVLGADGRPFKTREGGTVKLMDLLDEAERRAFDLVSRKSPNLPEEQRRQVARVVGIGAVKYADLCQNRSSDYMFSWEKMLSLEGNTAPYMQYAYARIRSIFRKAGPENPPAPGTIALSRPAERALALRLLQFAETVAVVAQECLPNLLCGYLYDLAAAFTGFYESCPVLQSEEPTRSSRLALCDLTARVIGKGLELLGIQTVEQM